MANRGLTPWRGSQGMGGTQVWEPFTSFRREIDRLFDDFLAPAEAGGFGRPSGAMWPSIELKETEQSYAVTAELPGLEQKDVELDLRDNVLTIRGEKREEKSQDLRGRHYSERSYGRFERRIPFEQEVDADKVEARFKNGVLSIDLPKNPRAADKTQRIEIKAQ
jgi:HSP20 family protein